MHLFFYSMACGLVVPHVCLVINKFITYVLYLFFFCEYLFKIADQLYVFWSPKKDVRFLTCTPALINLLFSACMLRSSQGRWRLRWIHLVLLQIVDDNVVIPTTKLFFSFLGWFQIEKLAFLWTCVYVLVWYPFRPSRTPINSRQTKLYFFLRSTTWSTFDSCTTWAVKKDLVLNLSRSNIITRKC